jgi:hypothetical protein
MRPNPPHGLVDLDWTLELDAHPLARSVVALRRARFRLDAV